MVRWSQHGRNGAGKQIKTGLRQSRRIGTRSRVVRREAAGLPAEASGQRESERLWQSMGGEPFRAALRALSLDLCQE